MIKAHFLISERKKQIEYKQTYAQSFFWRTKQQQEIDYIELNDGKLSAYEFKWSEKKNTKIPANFIDTYNAIEQAINNKNFRDFVVI
jgi:type IV secretory pathway VirB6-like protein